jgi:hypothetical protein
MVLRDIRQQPRGDAKQQRGKSMARLLLIVGFLALAVGLLWIGQGTGAIAWPKSSFMINQLQWAGYGALLGAVGLILIWQGKQ